MNGFSIKNTYPTDVSETMKALLIYAHFNPLGTVDPHVFHTLRHFLALGFRVVVASTSPICEKPSKQLLSLGAELILVENIGYDFYAWKSAITDPLISIQDFDRLVLLNSSVHGPFFDLSTFLMDLEQRDADILGATRSHEYKTHIQSYFFYFKETAIRSDAFRTYWENLIPYCDRQRTIDNHELGITEYFSASGLRIDSFFTPDDSLNPTLKHPDLLYKARLPFFKYTKINKTTYWFLRLKLRIRLLLLKRPPQKANPLF